MVHGINSFRQGAGAGGKTHDLYTFKPLWLEFRSTLHVVGRNAALTAAVHKAAGIIGIMAADHDHGLHLTEQLFQRGLAVFGGLAYRVDELNVGLGVELGHFGSNRGGHCGGGGGLAENTELGEGIRLNRCGIFGDGKRGEILHDAVDFHMAGRADDDHVATLLLQTLGGGVGLFDQRTGGVNKLLARSQQGRTCFFTNAMSRHQDMGGIRQVPALALFEHAKAACGQPLSDHWVMHQLSKYRYLHGIADGLGFGQGVAHAEAHAHVLRFENLHESLLLQRLINGRYTLQRKVIC